MAQSQKKAQRVDYKALGRLGGLARAKCLSKQERRAIASKAAIASHASTSARHDRRRRQAA